VVGEPEGLETSGLCLFGDTTDLLVSEAELGFYLDSEINV
jgi:hypothetical protein